MQKIYIEEGLMNAEIKASLYEFTKADTTDSDEITVTWTSRDDDSITEELLYDFELSDAKMLP